MRRYPRATARPVVHWNGPLRRRRMPLPLRSSVSVLYRYQSNECQPLSPPFRGLAPLQSRDQPSPPVESGYIRRHPPQMYREFAPRVAGYQDGSKSFPTMCRWW